MMSGRPIPDVVFADVQSALPSRALGETAGLAYDAPASGVTRVMGPSCIPVRNSRICVWPAQSDSPRSLVADLARLATSAVTVESSL